MLSYLKISETLSFPLSISAHGSKSPGTVEFSEEDETLERNKIDYVINL